MPGDAKFELIDGVVYMASPARRVHSRFQLALGAVLYDYELATPGCDAVVEATLRLGRKDEPQPDAFLRLTQEAGGSSHVDRKGYISGTVELAAEVASSTASYDLNQKKQSYLRHGVVEYMVVLTLTNQVLWFAREGDAYSPFEPDESGVFRSRVFPGLWLDAPALLAEDGARLKRIAARGLRSKEHAAFVKELRRRLRQGR
jgi:Uma2 family endonuclease